RRRSRSLVRGTARCARPPSSRPAFVAKVTRKGAASDVASPPPGGEATPRNPGRRDTELRLRWREPARGVASSCCGHFSKGHRHERCRSGPDNAYCGAPTRCGGETADAVVGIPVALSLRISPPHPDRVADRRALHQPDLFHL